MQNIHVSRYKNPESVGFAASIEPEDRSWVLFVPVDASAPPQLFIATEAEAENGARVRRFVPAADMPAT